MSRQWQGRPQYRDVAHFRGNSATPARGYHRLMERDPGEADLGANGPDDPKTVCISCGTPVELQRRRCPECGVPQRRLWVSRKRRPIGPLIAVGVILALLVGGLTVMMVGDKKAAPTRAFDLLADHARARDCSGVNADLSSAGSAAFSSASSACEVSYAFDWDGVQVRAVSVEGGSIAVVCVDRPPGAGISMRKESGMWRADAPAPTPHSECVAER